jgi:hypothetical protein
MAQHGLPQVATARAGHRRAADLASGRVLSGVAVSHLRRPGPPAVTARRDTGGWRFDGHVGWMTAWGICDVFLLAGVAGDLLVTAVLDAAEQPGLVASDPLALAAMSATRTVTLDLDGLLVHDADVVDVVPLAPWLEADRQKTANPGAHTVGLQRECTRRLAACGGTASELAGRLAEEGDRLRDASYRLVDDVPAAERLEERLALRAAGLDLAVRSATALVTATGGRAMALSHPAQRLLREAVFHVVQAQTGPVREATLRHWAGPA